MHQHLPKPKRKLWPAILGLILISVFSISQLQFSSELFQIKQIQSAQTIQQDENQFFQTETQEITFQDNQTTQYSISGDEISRQNQQLAQKDKVITYQESPTAQPNIIDQFRLPALITLLILFMGVTIVFTGKETIYSFLSLGLTVIILLLIIQAIFNGTSPLLATITGALAIATISIYVAHGFNTKTHLSTISIVSTLLFTLLTSLLFTYLAHMTGTGSESSFYLANSNISIDLRSLLLAGILVGTLGVLDDITTSQVATIHELHHTNHKLSFKELYQKGLNVGKTHISSLINTLVLAYAGGSLPLLILLYTDPSVPFWVTINQEFFAEEIIRTLIGSISLVLAVPISTFLAAKYYTSNSHKH